MDLSTMTIMRGDYKIISNLITNLSFAKENHFVDKDLNPPNLNFANTKVLIHHFPLERGVPL